MRDDTGAAEFLGYREVLHGRRGPGAFHCILFNASTSGAVVGQGGTRKAAQRDAASKAIAQDMESLLAAEKALAGISVARVSASPPSSEEGSPGTNKNPPNPWGS